MGARGRHGSGSSPTTLCLGLLAGFACHSTELSPADLRPPESARSAVIGVESGDLVRVAAFDLAEAPEVTLPHLEADAQDSMVVSARYYEETLASLLIPNGPISPDDQGHPLPARPNAVDAHRVFRGDSDSGWLDDGLGLVFARFRSSEFPVATGCRSFEPLVTLSLDATDRIQRATSLGQGALVLQPGRRLYRVQAEAVTAVHEERPGLVEALAGGWVTVASLGEDAVVLSCEEGAPYLMRLDADLSFEGLPTTGLPACPQELSAFEGRLFALVEGRSVFLLEPGAAEWGRLGEFSNPVPHPAGSTSIPFVALGPDRAAGIFVARPTPLAIRYQSMVLDPGGERLETLEVPDTTDFQLSQLTAVRGQLAIMLSDATLGSFLALRPQDGPWSPPRRIESQVVYGLLPDGDALLATGRFGFILEARVLGESQLEICPSSAIAPGNYATHLVAMGVGHYLLVGNSNAERPVEQYQSQTVTIARVR